MTNYEIIDNTVALGGYELPIGNALYPLSDAKDRSHIKITPGVSLWFDRPRRIANNVFQDLIARATGISFWSTGLTIREQPGLIEVGVDDKILPEVLNAFSLAHPHLTARTLDSTQGMLVRDSDDKVTSIEFTLDLVPFQRPVRFYKSNLDAGLWENMYAPHRKASDPANSVRI